MSALHRAKMGHDEALEAARAEASARGQWDSRYRPSVADDLEGLRRAQGYWRALGCHEENWRVECDRSEAEQ